MNSATKKALNSKFITGIHLALLLDGWDFKDTFSGLKYDIKKHSDWPESLSIFIVFGDYEDKAQYETDAFVEFKYENETVVIWNVAEFDYFEAKQMIIEYICQ